MTDAPRICSDCAHFAHRVENGADLVTCGRQSDGTSTPLHPHAQRTRQADEAAGLCGEQGIFWEARQ